MSKTLWELCETEERQTGQHRLTELKTLLKNLNEYETSLNPLNLIKVKDLSTEHNEANENSDGEVACDMDAQLF